MRLRRLRRRCEARLQQIGLPQPASIDQLHRALEERRGRPLRVHPIPAHLRDGSTSGVWLAMPSADYVFYEPATAPFHQDLIVLHEFSHMIWNHARSEAWTVLDGQSLPAGVQPAPAERVCKRTSYTEPQEREAEAMGSLILEKLEPARSPAAPPALPPGEAGEVLERLARLLGAGSPA